MGKKKEANQDDYDEIEEVVIRSMRAGFTWLDNSILDDWANVVGTAILGVYTLYCRRAMNNTQSTKLAQEVVAEHLRISKTTVSDALRILEWCDLIKVVRKHRSISKIYLKDTKPLTAELRATLRVKIAAGSDYMHLRTMLICHLDEFLSLGQRLDLFVAKSEKQKIKLVRADEVQGEPPAESVSVPVPAHTEKWQEVLNQLQMQMTQATFDTWVRQTELLEIKGNCWVVECESNFAKEWLESRLNGTVAKTAGNVAGQEVEINFVVKES